MSLHFLCLRSDDDNLAYVVRQSISWYWIWRRHRQWSWLFDGKITRDDIWCARNRFDRRSVESNSEEIRHHRRGVPVYRQCTRYPITIWCGYPWVNFYFIQWTWTLFMDEQWTCWSKECISAMWIPNYLFLSAVCTYNTEGNLGNTSFLRYFLYCEQGLRILMPTSSALTKLKGQF